MSPIIASIGPRHCRRGNIDFWFRVYRCFKLQLGHGIVAVETGDPGGRLQEALRASIGPRHCRRGNKPAALNAFKRFRLLQLGHGIVAVETALAAAAKDANMSLQLGHGIVAVETPRSRA